MTVGVLSTFFGVSAPALAQSAVKLQRDVHRVEERV